MWHTDPPPPPQKKKLSAPAGPGAAATGTGDRRAAGVIDYRVNNQALSIHVFLTLVSYIICSREPGQYSIGSQDGCPPPPAGPGESVVRIKFSLQASSASVTEGSTALVCYNTELSTRRGNDVAEETKLS